MSCKSLCSADNVLCANKCNVREMSNIIVEVSKSIQIQRLGRLAHPDEDLLLHEAIEKGRRILVAAVKNVKEAELRSRRGDG